MRIRLYTGDIQPAIRLAQGSGVVPDPWTCARVAWERFPHDCTGESALVLVAATVLEPDQPPRTRFCAQATQTLHRLHARVLAWALAQPLWKRADHTSQNGPQRASGVD